MINFNEEICANFEEASKREWLETNGIGGFASSTVSGANTRRYHALLTAAVTPPLGRVTMLSKFEETLVVNGKAYAISSNQYPNAIYPNGCKYLKSFRLAPFPVWSFAIEGIEIEKFIFMIHGANTVVCQYRIKNFTKQKSEEPENHVALELKPLLSFTDYHHLQRENSDFDTRYEVSENVISVKPYAEMPSLHFTHNARGTEKTGVWYRNFEYAIERERGFDFREDLFQPFALKFDSSETATIIASTEKFSSFEAKDSALNAFAENLRQKEIERRENLIEISGAKDDFAKQLVSAADQFIVSRGEGKTIIAGYPWFSDWGRDTMIALNGLTLKTNRPEIAKSILSEFAEHISEGMIPNRFSDAGEIPEYNTVDATLWFFEAVRAYVEKTSDYEFVREKLYEKLINIILWHLHGTRYQIRMDEDGLLCAGGNNSQLTWMDAKIGDYVVTPRTGKAVEIQALWFNALKIMEDFARQFGDDKDAEKYLEMAQTAKENFNRIFWNEEEECLFDVIEGETKDASVRPNQIFAVSLPHTMMSIGRARKIVEKVQNELLTAYGLRSLSPKDSRYRPIYKGTPFERDSAYHQGTVWAWLIGAFVESYRKVYPKNRKTEHSLNTISENFKNHLREAGIGQVSEIFDADVPHAPRGCFAQAWSVAEILRVLV